jgi:L-fuconolactonase
MRIDAHHHLWRYEPEAFGWIEPGSPIAKDFLVDRLAPELASAGIDATIAVQARQNPDETRFLLEAAQSNPAIIGVVGWVDLRAPDIDVLLEADTNPSLMGYRHVAQDEADPDFLIGDSFVAGVRAVAQRGLTYDLLISHAQMPTVPRFIDRVGEGRFVLDHAAKPNIAAGEWQPWADHLARMAQYPHLWCKVSGLVTEADHKDWRPYDIERYLSYLVELFGPDRLIWGSDWPVCLLAASYAQVANLVADFVGRHCPDAASDIFGGNAVRAYALDITR